MPAVSIIVLSYNRPDYLRVALDSVIAQTSSDYEVVIADDCSPDPNVDAVLREYAMTVDQFVYEKPERNAGVVANLLRAVARCSGRYLTILCDDDALQPEYVARLVAELDADSSLVAAFCNANIIDADGRVDAVGTIAYDRRWARDTLHSGPIESVVDAALVSRPLQPAMGAMFRAAGIDWNDFPVESAGAWDLWLAYLAARGSSRFAFVEDRLFLYRQHPGALTARRDVGWHRGQVYIYGRFSTDPALEAHQALFLSFVARYHSELGMALLRRGANTEARRSFGSARMFGSTLKTQVGSLLSYLPTPTLKAVFKFYDR